MMSTKRYWSLPSSVCGPDRKEDVMSCLGLLDSRRMVTCRETEFTGQRSSDRSISQEKTSWSASSVFIVQSFPILSLYSCGRTFWKSQTQNMNTYFHLFHSLESSFTIQLFGSCENEGGRWIIQVPSKEESVPSVQLTIIKIIIASFARSSSSSPSSPSPFFLSLQKGIGLDIVNCRSSIRDFPFLVIVLVL